VATRASSPLKYPTFIIGMVLVLERQTSIVATMEESPSWAFDTSRKSLGFMLSRQPGVLEIEMVFPVGRAKDAGLRESDIICNVASHEVSIIQDVAVALREIDISQSFSLEVTREGERITLVFPSEAHHRHDVANRSVAEQFLEVRTHRSGNGVLLESCQFIHSGDSSGEGILTTKSGGLEFVGRSGKVHLIPWDDIVDIQVTTSATSRVTLTRVLLIGLFALAAQKKQLFTVLEVETRYTTFAFVTTEPQMEVVETVRPLIEKLRQTRGEGVGLSPTATSDSAFNLRAESEDHRLSSSLGQQIRELATLKSEGLITEEEFAIGKAKILGA